MAVGFDLREEPWIPVRVGSDSLRVGLRELFQRAHEVEDLALPIAPAASGLLRILAAMTARIAGHDDVRMDDEDLAADAYDWFALRERVLAGGAFDLKAVSDYFDDERLAGRFDLFHPERPFLQDPRLLQECVDGQGRPNPSGVNKLVLGRPTGINGAVLFGHFTDTDPVAIGAAEAAWHLIAQLYYGPSGQCTPRRITQVRAGSGDAGPLRKTVSFHPWGKNLFTTLVLAVPVPDGGDLEADDKCPWEEELPDPLGPPVPVTWPGRLLTGRARHAALLIPSDDGRTVTDAYLTWSTHHPARAARDPYVIFDLPRGGGEPFARPADGQRALWRDVDALLLESRPEAARRPLALEELPGSLLSSLRVRAYGFDQDGQQRDRGWYEATTPPVLQWQQEVNAPMALHIGRCHQVAEDVADRLDYAARLAWKLTTDPVADPSAKVQLDRKKPGPWASSAAAAYWPAAERLFWRLATPEHLDTAPAPPFVDTALDALDTALGGARADLRTARARSRARAALRALLRAS
ncbi:type I-E CRISPR-associated protein Cse1/CasA [Streptomyces sp. SID1034]|uniref:type I-E CRISPR-associated protein Cse1/CasA n=1 Tax=Streptomyces sp. SID1034 TaxID=2690248 RepID=UPI00136F0122|nr:type I-E CRISPR-associated protein Cse1/CasA [Streptomyces sp. SID1034]MYV96416.1 type I-E CRISPR-associated protein Cse1/CasA [Streptomyces sp. SID1034]